MSSTPKTKEDELTFYGGRLMSAFPIVFFIVWAIVQTALWRVADTTGLTIALIIGMFFVRGCVSGCIGRF